MIVSDRVIDKTVRFKRQKQLIEYILSIGGSIKDVPGGAIGSAATSNNLHLVPYLKSLGADPNEQRGESKISTLYYLAERAADPTTKSTTNYWYRASKVLLENGADPNLLCGRGIPESYGPKPNSTGRATTVMHRAAYDGSLELLKLYLKHGGQINRRAQANHTPLYDAAMNGQVEVVKFLLSKGGDPRVKSAYGYDALGIAKLRKHERVVKVIEDHLRKK